MFFKKNRNEDQDVLDKYRGASCVICKKLSDPCHIKSRGAGGPDEDFNLVALCRNHHIEQHARGFIKMCLKYPILFSHLKGKGWYINDNKFKNPKLDK